MHESLDEIKFRPEESLDEIKFRPDTTTDSRVICPCASEKLTYNVVTTLAPSFLFVCLFVLMLYVPVNSYGHVGTSPPISWDFYPALR